MSRRATTRTAQAWIEPLADDPEAISALLVARERLPEGRALEELRRLRIFELSGALPERGELEALLHRSIQFYNPAKERCTLRLDPREPAPVRAGEIGVLVLERGGERRPAAERWWRHETGAAAEIREGVAWVMRIAGAQAESRARDLAILRDREHGLLCNPHWQDARIAVGDVPLPWLAMTPAAGPRGRGEKRAPKAPRAGRAPQPGKRTRNQKEKRSTR